MGSGKTAVSTLKMDRKFVGYNISKEYINITEKRIEPFLKQTKIAFNLTKIEEEPQIANNVYLP